MECMNKSEVYIMIEDHKKDFPEKPSFRLINHWKSDIGKVSKHVLDQINQNISQNTNVNQWKNSTLVVDRFKAINNNLQFMLFVFDMESFYPSTSLDLCKKALSFAKQITPTADSSLRKMMHSRKIFSSMAANHL